MGAKAARIVYRWVLLHICLRCTSHRRVVDVLLLVDSYRVVSLSGVLDKHNDSIGQYWWRITTWLPYRPRTSASVFNSCPAVYGFGRNAWPPIAAASVALTSVSRPLLMMTLTSGFSFCNARIVAGPSMNGIITSITTALISAWCWAYSISASGPSGAVMTL